MSKIKQSKPGYHMNPLKFSVYSDKKLCVIAHLNEYMQRTALLAPMETSLFISLLNLIKQ